LVVVVALSSVVTALTMLAKFFVTIYTRKMGWQKMMKETVMASMMLGKFYMKIYTQKMGWQKMMKETSRVCT
jgi:hypothetical protein